LRVSMELAVKSGNSLGATEARYVEGSSVANRLAGLAG
jgi:hypothetical protein